MLTLPPDIEARVRAALHGNERLVWAGQPIASKWARRGAAVCIVGLFFTAFSAFWMVLAILGVPRSRDNVSDTWAWLFPAFGIPFVLIGIGLLTTPLRLAARSRKTIYAITDRRVMIVQQGKSDPILSVPFDQLKRVETRESADGTGDLIFTVTDANPPQFTARKPPLISKNAFVGVTEVKALEELLRTVMA